MPYYRCRSCAVASYSAAGHLTDQLCPSCGVPLPGGHSPALPPPALRLSLPSNPASVGRARRTLAALQLPTEVGAAAGLVVSELVTNAIKHVPANGRGANGAIDVLVSHGSGELHLAVRDRGRGFAAPPRGVAAPSGGLGLVIVNSYAKEWDVQTDLNGCTVWCTLAAPPSETEARDDSRLRLIHGGNGRGGPAG